MLSAITVGRPSSSTSCDEHQVLFEIGRVDAPRTMHVGQRLAGELAMDDLAGDLLVRAGGIEAVRTGQVDQFDRLAARTAAARQESAAPPSARP